MTAFASSTGAELERLAAEASLPLEAEMVRGPETGLVTVRGRIGGGGAPFNMGEATVTRATARLPSGGIGHAYALGRDRRKAALSAILDACWCAPETRAVVEAAIVAPLIERAAAQDLRMREETAATRVDFFTLVRGED